MRAEVNTHLFIVVVEVSKALLLVLSVCIGVSRRRGCFLCAYCLWLWDEEEE
jgi:hypothetical protein